MHVGLSMGVGDIVMGRRMDLYQHLLAMSPMIVDAPAAPSAPDYLAVVAAIVAFPV